MLEMLAALGLGLLFGYMGLRAIRTGVAACQGFRFRRDEHYMRFWLVTTMYLSMSFFCLLLGIAGIIHLLVS